MGATWLMLGNTVLMSLREIRRNTLRSSLTALGIVIGVGAVIALVTLGEGATQKVTADISGMGVNMLTLFPASATKHGRKRSTACGSRWGVFARSRKNRLVSGRV